MRTKADGSTRSLITIEYGELGDFPQAAGQIQSFVDAARSNRDRWRAAKPTTIRDLTKWLSGTLERVLKEDHDFPLPPARISGKPGGSPTGPTSMLSFQLSSKPTARRQSITKSFRIPKAEVPAIEVDQARRASKELPPCPELTWGGDTTEVRKKKPPSEWDCVEVVDWLHEDCQMGRYDTGFLAGRVNGDRLLGADMQDLCAWGVCRKDDRTSILKAIKKLQAASS